MTWEFPIFTAFAKRHEERLRKIPVPENVRKRAQEICDNHTCHDCPLNRPVTVIYVPCCWLMGCMTGQCPVCKANDEAGYDTYQWKDDSKSGGEWRNPWSR